MIDKREALSLALHWSGAGLAFELLTRPTGAMILMYHSISEDHANEFIDPLNRRPAALFERQMSFLKRHRRVAPLSELVGAAQRGASLPSNTVCITFDDGYLDNLTVAAPILSRHKLPATLFLATGYVERVETQWADTLYWMLNRRTKSRLQLPEVLGQSVDLDSDVQASDARRSLHRWLLEAKYESRTRVLLDIDDQLKPSGRPPRLTMTWDEVRQLHSQHPLFEIGGHTRDHIDLSTCGEVVARSEIQRCAEDIRREVGIEPGHFAFPYGRWSIEAKNLVRDLGWLSALGSGGDVRIQGASDPFAMSRIDAPRTLADFKFKTSGAYPGTFSLFGLS